MGNKTVVQFVELFVKLADEHNACLATKNYNKRSKIAKKLMGMLAYIDTATNAKEIVSGIFNSGSKYAVMWISKYAFKNEICVEEVKAGLRRIQNEKHSVDSITAWARMIGKKDEKKS